MRSSLDRHGGLTIPITAMSRVSEGMADYIHRHDVSRDLAKFVSKYNALRSRLLHSSRCMSVYVSVSVCVCVCVCLCV